MVKYVTAASARDTAQSRPRLAEPRRCPHLHLHLHPQLVLRGTMGKIRILRDIKARNGVNATEITRRAYLYVARNQTLPPQVRYQAQLQLNTFGKYTRPTTVKNRCTETGRGRGVIGEFGLCRVCWLRPF